MNHFHSHHWSHCISCYCQAPVKTDGFEGFEPQSALEMAWLMMALALALRWRCFHQSANQEAEISEKDNGSPLFQLKTCLKFMKKTLQILHLFFSWKFFGNFLMFLKFPVPKIKKENNQTRRLRSSELRWGSPTLVRCRLKWSTM